MIQGITIQLAVRTQTGTDSFNAPIYSENLINVENVLVGQPTSEELNDAVSLYGKIAAYVLAIPKGDTHDWTDTEVILPEPFAGRYRTIGYPTAGIEANIPLQWNKKVKVEKVG